MTTRHIPPPRIDDCQTSGSLYETDSPDLLSEDMLDVALPNGLLISAGWYPDGDPDGSYAVCVFLGSSMVGTPFRTRDVDLAASHVEQLADMFRRTGQISGANADTDAMKVVFVSWSQAPELEPCN